MEKQLLLTQKAIFCAKQAQDSLLDLTNHIYGAKLLNLEKEVGVEAVSETWEDRVNFGITLMEKNKIRTQADLIKQKRRGKQKPNLSN